MANIIDKIIKDEASVFLKDDTIAEQRFDELVQKVDFRRLKPDIVLEQIDKKISRFSKTETRLIATSLIALIAMYGILIGADIKISYLGISLSSFEKLKEVVLIATSVSSLFIGHLQGAQSYLKEIRRRVFIKKFGDSQYELQEYLFGDTMSYDYELSLGNQKFEATNLKFAFEITRVFLTFMPVFAGLALYFYIMAFIAFEIWENSTFGPMFGRAIIVTIFLSAFGATTLNAIRKTIKFRYVDVNKRKELKFVDPETNEFLPPIKDLAIRDLQRKEAFRSFRNSAFVVLIAIYWLWIFQTLF